MQAWNTNLKYKYQTASFAKTNQIEVPNRKAKMQHLIENDNLKC